MVTKTLVSFRRSLAFQLVVATLAAAGGVIRATATEPPTTVIRGPYLQSGTKSNIVVRWRTSEPAGSRVRFGPSVENLNREVSQAEPTREHAVILDGLEPDTRYFYAVGNADVMLESGPEYQFVTAPEGSKPTRIWAIGDCGTAAVGDFGSWMVRDAYLEFAGTRKTDVWLMLGDNAYYSGTDSEYTDAVFNTFQELLRQTVLWSTIGNHETYSVEPDGNHAYFNIFSLPTAGQAGGLPSGTENYYSFDYANIHFVCLDSELSSRAADSPMLTWLEQDLAANTNDWLIAFWHSPPYTKGSHNSDTEFNLADIREQFLPVLENYGVDLVLCGHSHCYERSLLIDGYYGYTGTLTPSMVKDAGSGQPEETGAYLKPNTGPNAHEGTVYVVAGSSGWATFLQFDGPQEAMHTTLLRRGSMVIDVDGHRLDAKFLRDSGAIDDHFTILKGAGPESTRLATFRIRDEAIVAQFKSQAGRQYRIERTLSLTAPIWEPASDPIQATGATTSWSAPAEPGTIESYYRVMELD
jgi:hypothetical protein